MTNQFFQSNLCISDDLKSTVHKYIISRNTLKIKLFQNKINYEFYLRHGKKNNVYLDYYVKL